MRLRLGALTAGPPQRTAKRGRFYELSLMTTPSNKNDDKKPLNRREDPLARDTRGKATREEVRKVTPLINAPRQPEGPSKRR